MGEKEANNLSDLSRRSFLKAVGALGGASVFAACSKDGGDPIYLGSGGTGEEFGMPAEEQMTVITGGAARACGHLCVLKAHVKNGVVKRFTTDELPETDVAKDSPFNQLQSRACLRCRSWAYMMYSPSRLLYPLMQTGERGDLSTFKVVSWDTAMARIKTDFDRIRGTYGPGAVLMEQGGGNGGYGGFFLSLNTMLGGAITTRQDFSQGCWEHVANFVRPQRHTDFGYTWAPNAPFKFSNGGRDLRTGWIKGITGYNIVANAVTDLFNAEHIVIWSGNPAETFGVHHVNYYLKRCKEEGAHFTVIDQRHSPSVTAYADTFISPVQNTDSALVMAILHSLLTDNINEFRALHGAKDDAELKSTISKYVYGFFDDENPTSYNSENTIKTDVYPADFPVVTNADFVSKYKVPNGGSWSAYIFGDSTTLVDRGFNKATSIYPDKVGYCVRDYNYQEEGADPLQDKYVPCYGHVEKTPEWAEKITGVPAAQIRTFAKTLATKKTTILIGFGLQRQHEGEQATWSILTLSSLLLCFGAKGQSTGIPRAPGYVHQNDSFNAGAWLPLMYMHAGNVNELRELARYDKSQADGYMSNGGIDYDYLKFHDSAKLSFPELTDSYTRTGIPVKEIYDAIGSTNQTKVQTKVLRKSIGGEWEQTQEEVYPSLWNDGQVQRLPRPIKAILTCGSNKITSNGADVNRTVRVYHETDPSSGHPKKYKIEIVLVIDSFMTGNGRYADIVLPSAATFEKYMAPCSTQGNEVISLHGGKAVEPMGLAMNDVDMGWQYYKQWATGAEGSANSSDAMYKGYYGQCAPDEKMGSDEKVLRSLWENPATPRPFSYTEWKAKGVHYAKEYASNYRTIPASPADYTPIDPVKDVFIWNQEFREQPEKYPLHTPSGRVEAYCQSMIEDFEARNFFNYDEKVTLSAPIKFAGTPTGWETRGRYAYPVPMYIPTIEGRHACDDEPSAPVTDCNNAQERVTSFTKHPNPMGFANGFNYVACNYHPIQRAHTLHNSNPIINELFKCNDKGELAFYNDNGSATNPEHNAPKVATDGVYEPVLLNPNAIYADGSQIMNGDLVIVESQRGKGKYSAKLTKRVKPFHVSIAQGSAYNPAGFKGDKDEVDNGGSTGTHISHRPSRFGRGFTASDIRVKITKA